MGLYSQPLASGEDRDLQPATQETLHRHLAKLNQGRLSPRLTQADWQTELHQEFERQFLEQEYLESQRRSLDARLNAVPRDADGFMDWFERLRENGPGQGDPLFPWLATQATMEQLRWFLKQEIAGEAGFDDLVALAQLRLPTRAKLELASNYWDEMGRGHEAGMHGPMLEATARELGIEFDIDNTVWESLALANTLLALASSRRYAYQAIGALGAVELTAPSRVSFVNEGLRRLGVSAHGRRYFQLHAGLDLRHSESWNREAIRPLVSAQPECARLIAEGALLRLMSGQRCFQRYRSELGWKPGA